MTTVWRLLMDEVALPWVLANARIAIGWGEIGDIRQLGTVDAIAEAIRERNANHPNHAGRPEAVKAEASVGPEPRSRLADWMR